MHADALTVSTDNANECKRNGMSLREAFEQFRQRRLEERREALLRRRRESQKATLPRTFWHRKELRRRFVERARAYAGVPYAAKHLPEGSKELGSSLFLDCCGLIRRVVRDLKHEFGFTLGPGNQNYMLVRILVTILLASSV